MRLVVSDTSVFIDVEVGKVTSHIFQLPYEFAVPDVLFKIELEEQHSHLLDAGLKVKSLSAESIRRVEILREKYLRLSVMDCFALALALQEQSPLLTGDKALRVAAKEEEEVEVHGTVWIMEELINRKIIGIQQARNSFDSMKVKGSRLPWGDVDKILIKLALVEVENG